MKRHSKYRSRSNIVFKYMLREMNTIHRINCRRIPMAELWKTRFAAGETAIPRSLRHCANSKQLAMRPNFVCGFRVRMLDGSVCVRVSVEQIYVELCLRIPIRRLRDD